MVNKTGHHIVLNFQCLPPSRSFEIEDLISLLSMARNWVWTVAISKDKQISYSLLRRTVQSRS